MTSSEMDRRVSTTVSRLPSFTTAFRSRTECRWLSSSREKRSRGGGLNRELQNPLCSPAMPGVRHGQRCSTRVPQVIPALAWLSAGACASASSWDQAALPYHCEVNMKF